MGKPTEPPTFIRDSAVFLRREPRRKRGGFPAAARPDLGILSQGSGKRGGEAHGINKRPFPKVYLFNGEEKIPLWALGKMGSRHRPGAACSRNPFFLGFHPMSSTWIGCLEPHGSHQDLFQRTGEVLGENTSLGSTGIPIFYLFPIPDFSVWDVMVVFWDIIMFLGIE